MKNISLNQMESINAGDWIDVVDGVCGAVGVASWIGWAVPGGAVAIGACVVYTGVRVTGVISH